MIRGRPPPRPVGGAPGGERVQDREQRPPGVGQGVVDPRRDARVDGPADDPVRLQRLDGLQQGAGQRRTARAVVASGDAGVELGLDPGQPGAERTGQGEVLVEFAVDTTGRADTGSFAVVQASHPLFAEAVRESLPRMLFTPALAGGRRVRQLVRLPMKFRLMVPEKGTA